MQYDVRSIDKDRRGLLYEVEDNNFLQTTKPILKPKPAVRQELEFLKPIMKILNRNEKENRTRLTNEERKEIEFQVSNLKNLILGFAVKFLKNETENYRQFCKLYRVIQKMKGENKIFQINKHSEYLLSSKLLKIADILGKNPTRKIHSKLKNRLMRIAKNPINRSYYENNIGMEEIFFSSLDWLIRWNRIFSKPKIKNNVCILSFPSWL